MKDISLNTVSSEEVFEDSYVKLSAELEAIPADDLLTVNLDVVLATKAVLGALPEIQALRPRIQDELPKFDLVQFDKLGDYARALRHTQTRVFLATHPMDDLAAMMDEGTKLREVLKNDATALASHGLVDGRPLQQLKGAVGYMNVSEDLDALGSLLKDHWAKIQGKCGSTLEDLMRAKKLAARITVVLGVREQAPALIAEAQRVRTRAFTAFIRAYDRARTAIAYLRHSEDDADSIAPNLYPGTRKKSATEPNTQPAETAPAGTAASDTANTTQPGLGTAPAPSTNGSTAKPVMTSGEKNPFLP